MNATDFVKIGVERVNDQRAAAAADDATKLVQEIADASEMIERYTRKRGELQKRLAAISYTPLAAESILEGVDRFA